MTAVITADPKQLVEAYKHGDVEAFDEIVRCYYEGLFTHALRRLGDAHAAEDAVQETLLRAYGALHRFNGEYHLRAWLHRILSNVCHDEGNRRQRELRLVEKAGGSDVEAVAEVGDDVLDRLAIPRRQVLDALAGLPDPYRRALVLRYVEDLSFREVAEATGVTEGNARARVHRARAALKRTLGASVAVFAWLIPMVRKAERTAVAETGSSTVHATIAASHASPMLTRVAESGFVERAASLAGSLGIAASLAVPVGVSQVADHVSPPPAPATAELESVAAAPPSPAPAPSARESRSADSPAPARQRVGSTPTTVGASPAGVAVGQAAAVGAPPAAKRALPSGTADQPTPGASTPPPAKDSPSPPPPAPSRVRTFSLAGDDLTATSSWRTDLAGIVKVQIGDENVRGNLTGVLEAEQREEAPQPSPEDTTSGSTTTTAPPPPPAPRAFTGDLTLRFDDGRVVRLKLTGTLTDKDDGRSAATGDLRAYDEVCGTELGTAKLVGSILLRDAPLTSALSLDVDGVALGTAAADASGCAP